MQKISAYILTYNEAEKIEAAVSSVLWADEVVVVDSFSTDRTTEIATALGARVVQVRRTLRSPCPAYLLAHSVISLRCKIWSLLGA